MLVRMKVSAYAAQAADQPVAPWSIERREPRPNDVAIDILYCGVCHTDLHFTRNDWGNAIYPVVPGHEIVGRVSAVGSEARRYKAGDLVAVGCLVDSCQQCAPCRRGLEQYCQKGATATYNAPDRITREITFGGYSSHIVVREEFVLRIPDGLDVAKAAPLLCAGITTWSPLRQWNTGPGKRVGVMGLGGLGHMAVKFAAALGAEVTMITRTPGKERDARALGADGVLISGDAQAMKKAARSFDLIIDTIPVRHDLNPYVPLLALDGTLSVVGQVGPLEGLNTGPMLYGRRNITGSMIGGMPETQEMLDFCARKGILPEVEMIRIQDINEAYRRMERSDVRYRFVIDMASLRAA